MMSLGSSKIGANSITILNRNVDKAKNLSDDVLASDLIGDVNFASISEIDNYLPDADILV